MAGLTTQRMTIDVPVRDMDFFSKLAKQFKWVTIRPQEVSPYNKKESEKLLRIKSDMELGNKKKVEMSNFWDD